ncbi:hypothetical protein GN244_ATG11294 [Phytophthora infestans]|uniref:Uncharacterized protein n=1 Tax=Phytophthora infestans TaxID=4787 RepID=A0A833S8G3_PHYIN|nr:hypothetical protein GN244_ATG11294 [Phytophthora infestans]
MACTRSTRIKPLSAIEKEMNEIKRQMEGSRRSCIRLPTKQKLQQNVTSWYGELRPRELREPLPGFEAYYITWKFPKDLPVKAEECFDPELKDVESPQRNGAL